MGGVLPLLFLERTSRILSVRPFPLLVTVMSYHLLFPSSFLNKNSTKVMCNRTSSLLARGLPSLPYWLSSSSPLGCVLSFFVQKEMEIMSIRPRSVWVVVHSAFCHAFEEKEARQEA